MAEPKTKPTEQSVAEYLAAIPDAGRRADAEAVAALLERVVGEPGKMWGASIAGYGVRRLRYPSGQESDWMIVGFSSRKADLTLYLHEAYPERDALLARLGKHKTGKSCLYLKKLADVDLGVLEELAARSVAATRELPPLAH